MTPSHGWAPRGHRVAYDKPANSGKNINVVGAIRADVLVCHRGFLVVPSMPLVSLA